LGHSFNSTAATKWQLRIIMAKRAKRVINILLLNVALICIGILILELIFGNWINQDNLNKLNIIRDRTITYKIGELYESPLKRATYTRDKFGLRGQFENPSEIVLLTVGVALLTRDTLRMGKHGKMFFSKNSKPLATIL